MSYIMKYRKEQMNTNGDWQRYLHINIDHTPAPSGVSDISFKDEIVKQSVGTIARFFYFSLVDSFQPTDMFSLSSNKGVQQ